MPLVDSLKLIMTILVLTSAISSCRVRTSQVHIGNGVDAPDLVEFNRPIQMLYDRAEDRGICTLTFVNDTTALTAAHCVHIKGGLRDTSAVKKPDGQYAMAINTFVNPTAISLLDEVDTKLAKMREIYKTMYTMDPSCRTTTAEYNRELQQLGSEYGAAFDKMTILDFAVLVFPPGTGESFVAGGKYYGISSRKVEGGAVTSVKHVGFGHNERGEKRPYSEIKACDEVYKYSGFGTRRQGINSTVVFQGGALQTVSSAVENTDPDGKQVYTLGGDSGSMWIACEEKNCDTYEGIAITTGGGFNGVNKTSTGPRLYSKESLDLVQKAIHCVETETKKCAAPFKGSDLGNPDTGADNSIKVAVHQDSGKSTLSFSVDKSKSANQFFVCEADDIANCGSDTKNKLSTQPRVSGERLVFDNVLPDVLSKKIMILRKEPAPDQSSKEVKFSRVVEILQEKP